jgi:hypothetical protein
MLAMIAGLHSLRRKPQVNAMDQVFGTYRPTPVPARASPTEDAVGPGMLVVPRQGLEPRTVALRERHSRSLDLRRNVVNSHLPGRLLAGTVRR